MTIPRSVSRRHLYRSQSHSTCYSTLVSRFPQPSLDIYCMVLPTQQDHWKICRPCLCLLDETSMSCDAERHWPSSRPHPEELLTTLINTFFTHSGGDTIRSVQLSLQTFDPVRERIRTLASTSLLEEKYAWWEKTYKSILKDVMTSGWAASLNAGQHPAMM